MAEDCPEPDALWAAAAGKLSLEERRTIINHTLHCQDCAEDWRVAMRLGIRPKVSVWTYVAYLWTLVCYQIRQDLRFPVELVGRAVPWIKTLITSVPGRPSPLSATDPKGETVPVTSRMLTAAATAAAGVILLIAINWPPTPEIPGGSGDETSNPSHHESRQPGGTAGVESLVPDALDRHLFVLRWSGPEGARYDLRITTEDLNPLVSAHNLAVPEYQIPEEKLKDLEPGSVLLWQVIPLLPDQNRWNLKTFRTRIE